MLDLQPDELLDQKEKEIRALEEQLAKDQILNDKMLQESKLLLEIHEENQEAFDGELSEEVLDEMIAKYTKQLAAEEEIVTSVRQEMDKRYHLDTF